MDEEVIKDVVDELVDDVESGKRVTMKSIGTALKAYDANSAENIRLVIAELKKKNIKISF